MKPDGYRYVREDHKDRGRFLCFEKQHGRARRVATVRGARAYLAFLGCAETTWGQRLIALDEGTVDRSLWPWGSK